MTRHHEVTSELEVFYGRIPARSEWIRIESRRLRVITRQALTSDWIKAYI